MSAESNNSLATRASLLVRLKDWRQQTAWREFDHDYAPLLRNLARKAGLTDAEADDTVQETLLVVAKKVGEFQHTGKPGSFRAWLYQQARWRIADRFRLRVRAGYACAPGTSPIVLGALEEEPHAGHSSLEHAFEDLWNEEWESHVRACAIARVKRQTGARQFQLFDLHVIQGMSVQAAAQTAGATRAAVFMAKSRVGRLLRKEIRSSKKTDL